MATSSATASPTSDGKITLPSAEMLIINDSGANERLELVRVFEVVQILVHLTVGVINDSLDVS
jgi:hypothetical protein